MSGNSKLVGTRWVSSTYSSGEGGQCVQWAPGHAAAMGEVPVRDSKAPTGPQLCFSPGAWAAFVTSVKPRAIRWTSSTYSNGEGGQCVEWAPDHAAATGVVLVRDSKVPSGLQLRFGGAAWSVFLNGGTCE